MRRYPDGDLRRARGAGWRGWPGRVHIQYHHPEHGWTGGCPAAGAATLVPDDDEAPVTCRWCVNSGLVPARWLPGLAAS